MVNVHHLKLVIFASESGGGARRGPARALRSGPECRPVQKSGERRVSTFQLRDHAWECTQRRRAEIAMNADRVQIPHFIHTPNGRDSPGETASPDSGEPRVSE